MNVQKELLHFPCDGVGIGVGDICISKTLKFYVKVFYVMGKVLQASHMLFT